MWLTRKRPAPPQCGVALRGHCGRDCSQCDVFQATRTGNRDLRARAAQEWSLQLNQLIAPRQVFCHGCRSQGPKFFYCEQQCKIRKLALKWN